MRDWYGVSPLVRARELSDNAKVVKLMESMGLWEENRSKEE